MDKRNITFPIGQIASMGGSYIHSHWLYFANTVNQETDWKILATTLRKVIIDYLQKEVDFYQESQDAYVREVKKSNLNLTSKDAILENFNEVYKNQINNKKTNFGKLEVIKQAMDISGNYFWTKGSPNAEFKDKGKRGKDLKTARKEMREVLKGIENYIALVQKDANLGFLTGSRFAPKQGLSETLKRIVNEKERKLIEKELEELEIILYKTKELTGKDVNRIHKIIANLHIYSWSGILAEKFQADLIESQLPHLITKVGDKKKNFGDVAKKFMQFNVIDVAMGEVETTHGTTLIGLSQKFTKKEFIQNKDYKNEDIFHSLENYATNFANAEKDQVASAKSLEHVFKYIRNNMISLLHFSLDYHKNAMFDMSEFIEVEEELALLRNFLRFFNGMMEMLEDGTLNVFNSSAEQQLKNTRVFTAFLAFRQNIYWTIDFIKPIMKVIETEGKIKGIDGFSAKAKIRAIPNVTKEAANLWNAKKKRLKELKKLGQNVDYGALQTGNIPSLINDVTQAAGGLIVDSLVYTLNPAQFFNTKK